MLLGMTIRNSFGTQRNVIYKLLDYIQKVKKYYMLDSPMERNCIYAADIR